MRNDRYESLDGIKGFALIGIIWYHLSQRSLPGGFIGVDVFFTVSGFLLALSVLREIDRTGRLRLGNFYLRRLSRLWPAMAFMIAGSVSLGLFVNHDILVGVPGKSVSALTFTSNWGEIFSGDSYFAATSPQLLRHLWFVALLAQATLVLPLLTAMLPTPHACISARTRTVLACCWVSRWRSSCGTARSLTPSRAACSPWLCPGWPLAHWSC